MFAADIYILYFCYPHKGTLSIPTYRHILVTKQNECHCVFPIKLTTLPDKKLFCYVLRLAQIHLIEYCTNQICKHISCGYCPVCTNVNNRNIAKENINQRKGVFTFIMYLVPYAILFT